MTSISRARLIESAVAASSRRVSAAVLSARALSGFRLSGRAVESGEATVAASVLCTRACAFASAAPATPRVPTSASVSRALRATGLSLRSGRLDVGPDLELGLQKRAGRVAQRLAGRGAGLIEPQVVGHDDPLQARHVGEE